MSDTMLITGGAGFIGSNFVHYMLGRGRRIVCVDKLTYAGSLDNLAGASGYDFIRADICDKAAMRKVFADYKPSVAVNFAAESHVDRAIENPEIFLRTNVLGVQTLIDCCLESGAHFHQISTDEVYGDVPRGSSERFDEVSPLRPSGPYSASKAAADLLALACRRTYGLRVTISRSANNYGMRQHSEKFIPHMVLCAVRGERMPIYGDGENMRDWLYVGDHCRAIELLLEKGADGGVYNISGHCEKRNIDVARAICDILGAPHSLIEFVPDRKGHDYRYPVSSRAIEALGWKPETDWEEGLERTVKHYAEVFAK